MVGLCLELPAWVCVSCTVGGPSSEHEWTTLLEAGLLGREQQSENLQTGKRNTAPSHPLQVFDPMGRPYAALGLTRLSSNPTGRQHWLQRLRNAKAPVLPFSIFCVSDSSHVLLHFDRQQSYKVGATYDSHFTDEKIEAWRDLVTCSGIIERIF